MIGVAAGLIIGAVVELMGSGGIPRRRPSERRYDMKAEKTSCAA
jgi:hypothetical protein